MHSTAGMSGLTSGSPELRKELSRLTNVTTSKRTPDQNQRIAEIECEFAIYWQADRPIITAPVFRSAIEQAARVTKDGPRVRRGLQVLDTTFDSPLITAANGDRHALITAAATQHVVKVGQQRIIRTRGGFPEWRAHGGYSGWSGHRQGRPRNVVAARRRHDRYLRLAAR